MKKPNAIKIYNATRTDIPFAEVVKWVQKNWWWISIVSEKIYTFILTKIKQNARNRKD